MRTRLKFKRKNVLYPFSKIRVYFNAVFGLVALILSISLLATHTDFFTVLTYITVTAILTGLSTKLKIHLLRRLEKIQSEPEESDEEEGSILSWKLVAIIIILGVTLMFPVITAVFISPLWWFIGFSSFVVGFSLSEILLYMLTQH